MGSSTVSFEVYVGPSKRNITGANVNCPKKAKLNFIVR